MNSRHRLLQGVLLAALLAAAPAIGGPFKGWLVTGSKPAEYDFGKEHVTGSAGAYSAFIHARLATPTGFGTLMQEIAADNYQGKRLRLSARLKTADANRAQLWLRIDGTDRSKSLAFYNMDDRAVTGTTDWKRYDLVLDVPQNAVGVAFGFFLDGKGEAWADDFKLEIVDNSVPVSVQPSPSLPKDPVNLNFDQ